MNEKRIAFVAGTVFLLTLLSIMILSEKLTAQQFFVVRLIAGLAASAFAALLPGFINVEMSLPTNWAVRGGGAIAVFLVVWYVNPPTLEENGPTPDFGVETEGFLGDFRDHIMTRVSTEVFILTFDPKDKTALKDFHLDVIFGGATYGEVVQKICARYSCLICKPKPTLRSRNVELSITNGPLVPSEDSANLVRKKLRCP